LGLLCWIGPALLGVFACATKPQSTPAVPLQAGSKSVSTEPVAGGPGILVWGKTAKAEPKTYRLLDDGSGHVIDERPGIWIHTSKGELGLVLETKQIALSGCSIDETPPQRGQGTLTIVELRSPDGRAEQTLLGAGFDEFDVNDLEHGAEVLGTIGSVVFLNEHTYVYACGAHGNTTAGFFAWDAELGKAIDLFAAVPNQDVLSKKANALINAESGDDASVDDDVLPTIVQLLPVYSARGALRLDAQWMRSACYACSDGLWSSYSRSAILETGFLHPRFASYAVPPVSIKVFLEAHPGFEMGGFSR
jgi:hypothetical protein